MRTTLLTFFCLLAACDPTGQAYSVRRAELDLVLPCEDTADCERLRVTGVPFEREEHVQFDIVNPGERALSVTLSIQHPDFGIEPATTSVPAGGSARFQLTYAPSVIDDQEAALLIEHNATGPDVEIEVLGTTDADADADGFRHEQAPGGDDCNDFNASVNPGMDEIWYDGVDQDCDGGSDYDQDGDGHDILTRPDGDDCDDEDPRVYPGAPDPIDEDEIDSDCDGEDG
jgi:hypothetical protein